MQGGAIAYLDNAATSWPKAPGVADAMARAIGSPLGNAGRGGHAPAAAAWRLVRAARERLARRLGGPTPDRIVLTGGCTEALNLAIHGVLEAFERRRGAGAPARVVTTALEHNGVLRPLAWRAERRGVEVVRVGFGDDGVVDPDAIGAAIDERTALVCVTHASNVTGVIQPIEAIAGRVRRSDALLLVDAAQTAGVLPIDAEAVGADLVAFGGHKGLLGPTGVGGLFVGPRAAGEPGARRIEPILHGGTGSDAPGVRAEPRLPEDFEPGSPNAAACAGLIAALDWLDGHGPVLAHEREMLAPVLDWARGPAGLRVPAASSPRVGVVALDLGDAAAGLDAHAAAAALDASFGVAVRGGLHCAPDCHAALGTAGRGMVRVSVGPMTTLDETARFVEGMRALVGG